LLEQDSKRITVEEAVARSRENSRGSGVTADDVLASIEESRSHRP
jgi:hypothetical protein